MPRHDTAHPYQGRRPVQGVAALSPRRNAAPAASVQVPAPTRAPRCSSVLTARRDAGSRPRSGSRGCYAEARAEEARRARPRLSGPAGANRSQGPPRTRPASRPRASVLRKLALMPAASLSLLVAEWTNCPATYQSDWRAHTPTHRPRLLSCNRMWRRFKEIGNRARGASSGAHTPVTLS